MRFYKPKNMSLPSIENPAVAKDIVGGNER